MRKHKELHVNHQTKEHIVRKVLLDLPISSITMKGVDIELLHAWCLEVERQLETAGIRINCPMPVKGI